MRDTVLAERQTFRHRLLAASAVALAVGGTVAALAVALAMDAPAHHWLPYGLAPLAGLLSVWLDRRGQQPFAVALVATVGSLLAAQAGIREPHSVAGALYLLPVALFCITFVDRAPRRRLLLGALLVAVAAQRALRGLAGVDVSVYGWVEGTFHSVAVFAMFAVLVELLHHRQSLDRQALEDAYDGVAVARASAEAEAASAVASSRAKSGFLEAMSHELRTPLNAVVGYAELLLEEEEAERDVAVRSDLSRVRDAGTHMVGLVDDVLDMSKVASGRLERDLAPVDVAGLLRETAVLAQPLLSREVDLVVEVPPEVGTVVTDGQKLRQILVNLLSNAARFTSEGEVRLSARRDAEVLQLEVEDTGTGMDPAQVDRLFEAFAQVDHREGTGLGLALCARFAELLGGTIAVDTALGRGSRFTVAVPTEPTAGPASAHDVGHDGQLPMELPISRRAREAAMWLRVGTATATVFGMLCTGLVAAGVLESHLGVWPFVGLTVASAAAYVLNQVGARGGALGLFLMAALGVDAHSHVFHAHAQAAVLYLCVVALYVSLVVPRRFLPSVLWGGGAVAGGMLALRWGQRLDTFDAFVSITVDTVIIYTSSSVFLHMLVARHRYEEEALAHAAFDLDRLRVQAADMARVASTAAQAKATFLASMSHELRSPLSAILGYSELLLDELPAGDERRGDVGAIHHAARDLLGLVNEVLDLARIQAGGMPIACEDLDLVALVEGAGLARVGAGRAEADPHLLRRALTLLAARGAGPVRVTEGALEVSLPCDLADDVATPFAHDPCMSRPGVGWALLHELVAAMGGRVALTPHAGQTEVRLLLTGPSSEATAA